MKKLRLVSKDANACTKVEQPNCKSGIDYEDLIFTDTRENKVLAPVRRTRQRAAKDGYEGLRRLVQAFNERS